jgi:hypothetical protein
MLNIEAINIYSVNLPKMLIETIELIYIRFTNDLLAFPLFHIILILIETKGLTAKISKLQQFLAQSQVPATVKVPFLSTLSLIEKNQVQSSSCKYSSRSSYRSC